MPKPHRHRYIRLITILAAMTTFVSLLVGDQALADPDFSNVSDMLGGRRHLAPQGLGLGLGPGVKVDLIQTLAHRAGPSCGTSWCG